MKSEQIGNYNIEFKNDSKGPVHSLASWLSTNGAYDSMNFVLKWLKVAGGSPELITKIDLYTQGCAVVRALPAMHDLVKEVREIRTSKEPLSSPTLLCRVTYKFFDACAMSAFAIAFFASEAAAGVGKTLKLVADFAETATNAMTLFKARHLSVQAREKGLAPEICRAIDHKTYWLFLKTIKAAGGALAGVLCAPASLVVAAIGVSANVTAYFSKDYFTSAGEFAEFKYRMPQAQVLRTA
jgi:hypothetical protein